MKKFAASLLALLSLALSSQNNYLHQNINLISVVTPNPGPAGDDGRLYSGCWGWYQQPKNREYAISGASNGTYFIDITSPATPTVCDFVPGRPKCTWREVKTYQNICYIISDDPSPNTFQIVDLQYLPDSVHVIRDDSLYFEHSHTLWVDHDHLYVGSVTYTTGAGFSPMNVYSIATPSVPVLLRELKQDIQPPLINAVHDMFSRNDTVYASCGWEGMYILKYDSVINKFIQLGSYSGYASSAYNHSSQLTKDGKRLLFCDEVPAGQPIHFVDVQNLGNIQPIEDFRPNPATTPHNPYLMGNDFAVVACYQDGLYIYDISSPGNAAISGYFDTHPQGGANVGDYFAADYRGNWGAYPYLPSGIIIAQDMQNGVFLLDATQAFTNRVGIQEQALNGDALQLFPNPAANTVSLRYPAKSPSTLQIRNMLGQVVYQKNYTGAVNEQVDVNGLANGTYVLSLMESDHSVHRKLVVNH